MSIEIRDEENDFPMTQITRLRVGSAHVVLKSNVQEKAVLDQLRIIAQLVNDRSELGAGSQPIDLIRK